MQEMNGLSPRAGTWIDPQDCFQELDGTELEGGSGGTELLCSAGLCVELQWQLSGHLSWSPAWPLTIATAMEREAHPAPGVFPQKRVRIRALNQTPPCNPHFPFSEGFGGG